MRVHGGRAGGGRGLPARRTVFLLFWFLFFAGSARAQLYSYFGPVYTLTGAADLDYTSDKLKFGGQQFDISSFTQDYNLDLGGPIIGPYFGMFTLDTSFSRADSSANGAGSASNIYSLGGTADFFPVSKYPVDIYFDVSKADFESTGFGGSSFSDNAGFQFNPRLGKTAITVLTFDHAGYDESAAGRSSSSGYNKANLYYSDLRRIEDAVLTWSDNLGYFNSEGSGASANNVTNDLGFSFTKPLYTSRKTLWTSSAFGSYYVQKGSESGYSGQSAAVGLNSYLSHYFAPDINGLLNYSHSTSKPQGQSLVNYDSMTAAANYMNVPNPVPDLAADMEGTAGWTYDWSGNYGENAGYSLQTVWSRLPAVDVLNDLGYSYTTNVSVQNTFTPLGAPASQAISSEADAFIYRFGLRGRGRTLNWFADYQYQQSGVFTAYTGRSNSVSAGEALSLGNFTNQTLYQFSATETSSTPLLTGAGNFPAGLANSAATGSTSILEHLLQSTSFFVASPFLNFQSMLNVLDMDVSAGGLESDSLTENGSLNVNWLPFLRLTFNGGGYVSNTSGSGGSGMGWGLSSGMNYLFDEADFNVNYTYSDQTAGGARSTDSRVEARLTIRFGRIVGNAG